MSSSNPKQPDQIQTLAVAVQRSKERLEEARKKTEFARSQETDALNEFNQATKAFEAAVADFRKAAPWGTDWSITTTHSVAVKR